MAYFKSRNHKFTTMIGVGINENVILEKAEITEATKGTLALTFKENTGGENKLSAFEQLQQDGYAETSGNSMAIRVFAPLPPYAQKQDGTPVPQADQQKQAEDAIKEKKNLLYQILTTFMTSDKVKLDPYRNTGLTGENFPTRILQEETLNKIMGNMAEDFVRLITPYLDKPEYAVRLLLVRQSKTKHYASFRDRFVKDNPIIESMKIPVAQTVLKFTKHEITNHLNDGTVVTMSEADTAAEAAETQTVESVFGGA